MSDIVQEQLGPCTLSWRDGVFPLGSDALMLGRFAAVKPGWRVCDLGTGSGVLYLGRAVRRRRTAGKKRRTVRPVPPAGTARRRDMCASATSPGAQAAEAGGPGAGPAPLSPPCGGGTTGKAGAGHRADIDSRQTPQCPPALFLLIKIQPDWQTEQSGEWQ